MSRVPAGPLDRRELLYGLVAGGGLLAVGVGVRRFRSEDETSAAAPGYGGPPYGGCGFGE